jgi:hypothetical protein
VANGSNRPKGGVRRQQGTPQIGCAIEVQSAMVERNASMRRGASSNPTSPSTPSSRSNASAPPQSDNAVYLAQRERIIEGMRLAGVPEG